MQQTWTISITYFQLSCHKYGEACGQKKFDYIVYMYKYIPLNFWLKNLEKIAPYTQIVFKLNNPAKRFFYQK